jgi:hypothetical protein
MLVLSVHEIDHHLRNLSAEEKSLVTGPEPNLHNSYFEQLWE